MLLPCAPCLPSLSSCCFSGWGRGEGRERGPRGSSFYSIRGALVKVKFDQVMLSLVPDPQWLPITLKETTPSSQWLPGPLIQLHSLSDLIFQRFPSPSSLCSSPVGLLAVPQTHQEPSCFRNSACLVPLPGCCSHRHPSTQLTPSPAQVPCHLLRGAFPEDFIEN